MSFFLVSTRTSNPPSLPPLLVRLFSDCTVVLISLLFWGVTEFQDTYHGSLYLYIFLFFLCGFLFCWCERNTGRHFIGFLLIKINLGRQITYGDKIQNATTTRHNKWQTKILTLLAKWVSKYRVYTTTPNNTK